MSPLWDNSDRHAAIAEQNQQAALVSYYLSGSVQEKVLFLVLLLLVPLCHAVHANANWQIEYFEFGHD